MILRSGRRFNIDEALGAGEKSLDCERELRYLLLHVVKRVRFSGGGGGNWKLEPLDFQPRYANRPNRRT